jgi:hypothetical protein
LRLCEQKPFWLFPFRSNPLFCSIVLQDFQKTIKTHPYATGQLIEQQSINAGTIAQNHLEPSLFGYYFKSTGANTSELGNKRLRQRVPRHERASEPNGKKLVHVDGGEV